MVRDFESIQSRNGSPFYFGSKSPDLTKATIERIVKYGLVEKTPGNGWKDEKSGLYVKKVKPAETKVLPCVRFDNAKLLYLISERMKKENTPQPMAMIHSGTPQEITEGQSQAFYIAENIPGPNLFSHLKHLNTKQRGSLMTEMGIHLSDWNSKGVYLMDFAPRDVVLKEENPSKPYFVDTEHIKILLNNGDEERDKEKKELRQEQATQFREDYQDFLTKNEIEEMLKIID